MPEDVKVGKTPAQAAPGQAAKPARQSMMPFQKRKQLERDIEHITGEMYKRNKELAETNKTLSLLRTIDALVLESHASLKMVSEHITQAITQVTDYPFVGLLTRSSHTREELVLSGWSGSDWLGRQPDDNNLGLEKPVHIKLIHPWFAQIESSRMVSLAGLDDEQLSAFLGCHPSDIKRLKQRIPLKSLYVLKLLARRQIVGLLIVGYTTPVAQLSETDTALMDRLSESIGVALDNKLLFEQNQHVLRQLQESNAKLVALDEAKDDFISMASHQLRTPLTSVKGYISMVLEGDAGKLTPTQKKLLNQSFFSAQRMVYLIADLLNVSRLKTGKFVMEPASVNLASVVEEELSQLKDTAAAHELKLTYHKPKKFTEVMLDETKTRQVIMNFVDNAIYYTPSGGHIDVQLKETPATIEFKVVDDGIGVPKSEQRHLFTKFYRAGNARKARPDGTGLGLFMAKKVIVVQGGSLIFESKEGSGSTFGFIFSKHKLAVEAEKAQKAAQRAATGAVTEAPKEKPKEAPPKP
jgi:signal transduction histidine kinase